MPSMMSYPSVKCSSCSKKPLTSASLGLSLGPTSLGFWSVASLASAVVSARHGYYRHRKSTGWALGWGALGLLFPILTPAWAVFVQGYAKPEK